MSPIGATVGGPTVTKGWTAPFSSQQYHLWWNGGLFIQDSGFNGGFFCFELMEVAV